MPSGSTVTRPRMMIAVQRPQTVRRKRPQPFGLLSAATPPAAVARQGHNTQAVRGVKLRGVFDAARWLILKVNAADWVRRDLDIGGFPAQRLPPVGADDEAGRQ
jgi:hypothetical protein